jgi:hypothetical protein
MVYNLLIQEDKMISSMLAGKSMAVRFIVTGILCQEQPDRHRLSPPGSGQLSIVATSAMLNGGIAAVGKTGSGL